jgi:2-hydroxychromene-2-carboxylate isomerase
MVVEFVFDYPSPYAYLASTQLESLGVPARHEPVGIVEVMKSVNNRPSPACPPKARYSAIDVARWAHRYGVPFEINQAFLTALGTGTFDHQILTRGALVAQEFDAFAPYNAAMFAAIWGKPPDIMTEGGRAAFLKGLGLTRRVSGGAQNDPICTPSSSGARRSPRKEVEASSIGRLGDIYNRGFHDESCMPLV